MNDKQICRLLDRLDSIEMNIIKQAITKKETVHIFLKDGKKNS